MTYSWVNKHCIKLATLSLLALLGVNAHATVSITGLDDITITAWAGNTGALEGSDSYCVLSCNGSCNQARHYDVAAYTSGATDGAGNFYLTHTGDGTTTLPVSFEWSHPASGTFTMTNYNVTGFTAPPSSPYAPGATSCAQTNSQNTITIRIAQGDLASALSGTYSGTLLIDMCRLQANGSTAECVNPINFTVNLPELIQITQLQNFSISPWAGSGDVQQTNNFCVFRNGYGGFSILASGNNDSGSAYRMANGTTFLPYGIEFSDGGAWHAVSPGTQLSSSTTGFSGDSTRDCGGSPSHSMRVNILESDLDAANAGDYSDTVTIVIQPE